MSSVLTVIFQKCIMVNAAPIKRKVDLCLHHPSLWEDTTLLSHFWALYISFSFLGSVFIKSNSNQSLFSALCSVIIPGKIKVTMQYQGIKLEMPGGRQAPYPICCSISLAAGSIFFKEGMFSLKGLSEEWQTQLWYTRCLNKTKFR